MNIVIVPLSGRLLKGYGLMCGRDGATIIETEVLPPTPPLGSKGDVIDVLKRAAGRIGLTGHTRVGERASNAK